MKKGTRIISFLLVAVFIFQMIPSIYATDSVKESASISLEAAEGYSFSYEAEKDLTLNIDVPPTFIVDASSSVDQVEDSEGSP